MTYGCLEELRLQYQPQVEFLELGRVLDRQIKVEEFLEFRYVVWLIWIRSNPLFHAGVQGCLTELLECPCHRQLVLHDLLLVDEDHSLEEVIKWTLITSSSIWMNEVIIREWSMEGMEIS